MYPGSQWLAHSVGTSRRHQDALVGGNGRIFKGIYVGKDNELQVVQRYVGDNPGKPQADTVVDFVGHCWTFPTHYAHLFWKEMPLTHATGEDFQFGWAMQKHSIRSVVPSQSNDKDRCDSNETVWRHDEHASWLNQTSAMLRMFAFCYGMWRGFKPVSCGQLCSPGRAQSMCRLPNSDAGQGFGPGAGGYGHWAGGSGPGAGGSRPRAGGSGPRPGRFGPMAGGSGPRAGGTGPWAGGSGPKAGRSGPRAGGS